MDEDGLIRVVLPYAPEGVPLDLEATIEAMAPAHTAMLMTATAISEWPEYEARRAALILAISAILDAEGVDAAIAAVRDELEALQETAS